MKNQPHGAENGAGSTPERSPHSDPLSTHLAAAQMGFRGLLGSQLERDLPQHGCCQLRAVARQEAAQQRGHLAWGTQMKTVGSRGQDTALTQPPLAPLTLPLLSPIQPQAACGFVNPGLQTAEAGGSQRTPSRPAHPATAHAASCPGGSKPAPPSCCTHKLRFQLCWAPGCLGNGWG